MCWCMHTSAGVPGVQRRMSNPWELVLQVAVSCFIWVLGTKLGSSRKQQTLKTTEPSLTCIFLEFRIFKNVSKYLKNFSKDSGYVEMNCLHSK